MTTYGYFLASEDHGPRALIDQARMAEQAGFEALWISDHYHPWLEVQGHSPFVWTTIGGLAEATRLPVETAVTCPTVRIHPAVVAQAVATSAVILDNRFRFGVGSGEALNEHVLGTHWPRAEVRQAMLAEALHVIRRLLTGERVSHEGRYYTVENARLYTLPDQPVPIDVSAFAPAAAELAAETGDGFVTMGPEAELLRRYRAAGGRGPAACGVKACYDRDPDRAAAVVHERWANMFLPGELAAVLPEPAHFRQATRLVTEQDVRDGPVPLGDDPDEHVRSLRACAEAGYDRVYVNQIGPDVEGFFDLYRTRVLSQLR